MYVCMYVLFIMYVCIIYYVRMYVYVHVYIQAMKQTGIDTLRVNFLTCFIPLNSQSYTNPDLN
jgi:hypothetical protein